MLAVTTIGPSAGAIGQFDAVSGGRQLCAERRSGGLGRRVDAVDDVAHGRIPGNAHGDLDRGPLVDWIVSLIVKSVPPGVIVLTPTPAPWFNWVSCVAAVKVRSPSCVAVVPPFSPMEKSAPLTRED